MSDRPVAPSFELPNVGPGPDPCSLSALASGSEFVVCYFHRGHDCTECRKQAKRVRDRYDGFRARDAVAVSILPDSRDRARSWQERFELPFPLLADPDSEVGDAYGQPARLTFIDDWSDFFGRMPTVVVVDARGPDPRIAWTHAATATWDRPTTNDVLEAVDDCRETDPPRAAGT